MLGQAELCSTREETLRECDQVRQRSEAVGDREIIHRAMQNVRSAGRGGDLEPAKDEKTPQTMMMIQKEAHVEGISRFR